MQINLLLFTWVVDAWKTFYEALQKKFGELGSNFVFQFEYLKMSNDEKVKKELKIYFFHGVSQLWFAKAVYDMLCLIGFLLCSFAFIQINCEGLLHIYKKQSIAS